MNAKLKSILLTILTIMLLAGFAAAVPSPCLTEKAQQAYLNIAPADPDDEYAFLFE